MKFMVKVSYYVPSNKCHNNDSFLNKDGTIRSFQDDTYIFDSKKSCMYYIYKSISDKDYWKGCTDIKFEAIEA